MDERTWNAPSVQRIRRVVIALGRNLTDDVVFIGGSIAPLLHTASPFPAARATKDLDGVVLTASYAEHARFQEALRARKFREDVHRTPHMHRWITPDNDLLDIVPAGDHLGTSGQRWDRLAVEHRVTADIRGGLAAHHASAPIFLCLKWAAFDDRGISDPYASHDLLDILAVIAARDTIVGEVANAVDEVLAFTGTSATKLLNMNGVDDILAAHLNNSQDPFRVQQLVLERLRSITTGITRAE